MASRTAPRKYTRGPGAPEATFQKCPPLCVFPARRRRDDSGNLSSPPARTCSEAAPWRRKLNFLREAYPGSEAWIPAQRVGTMRLGSGTFAACCVRIEVLGLALFLRGFFPAPVSSSSGTERQVEHPAPEPSTGTDHSPGVSAPQAPLSPEKRPDEPCL